MEFPKEPTYDPLKVPKHSPIGRGRTTSWERQQLAFALQGIITTRLPNNYDPTEYSISCGNDAYYALKWVFRASPMDTKIKQIPLKRLTRCKDPCKIVIVCEPKIS